MVTEPWFPILQSRILQRITGESPVRSHCRPVSSSTSSSPPHPFPPARPRRACSVRPCSCGPARQRPCSARHLPRPYSAHRWRSRASPPTASPPCTASLANLTPAGPSCRRPSPTASAHLPRSMSASARRPEAELLSVFFPPLSVSLVCKKTEKREEIVGAWLLLYHGFSWPAGCRTHSSVPRYLQWQQLGRIFIPHGDPHGWPAVMGLSHR